MRLRVPEKSGTFILLPEEWDDVGTVIRIQSYPGYVIQGT
jgi:hypothetical protein